MRRIRRALLYGGVVVLVLGFGKAHAQVHGYSLTGSFRFAWSVAYVAILLVGLYGLGFPELRRTRREAWSGAALAVALSALGISLAQLMVGDALLPRFVLFGSGLAVVPWTVLCAQLSVAGTVRGNERERVLLVARGDDHLELVEELLRSAELDAQVVGHLTPQAASTTAGCAPLLDLGREREATVLVLGREAQADESVVAQAALLHESGTRVRTLSLFYEQWLGKLPMNELERVALMFDIGEVHRRRYTRLKRMGDLALGLAGLLPLALVAPVVMVGNRIANRGGLIFRQERVGKAGVRFEILKFRTMEPSGADGDRGRWTAADDRRITPFGRFLRRTHLDELPQIVNILRGDLSVVGPRPEQPAYVGELVTKLPFYDLRHLVRPGLTGWAQVKYGYAGDERDALEKLQYEFFYLRHQSVRLDARIIGRTVRSVMGGQGGGR